MHRFRFRLLWLFVLMLLAALVTLAARQIIGFGWSNSLIVATQFSFVKDGTTLVCFTFRDPSNSVACVAIQEVVYVMGVPVSSEMPNWLTTDRLRRRLFVEGREVVHSEGRFSVFCSDTSGIVFVKTFSAEEMVAVENYLLSDERKLFDRVFAEGEKW